MIDERNDTWVAIAQLIVGVSIFLLVLFLSGCSTIEWGAKYVVNGYCDDYTLEERMLARYNVNHMVHPHKVEITCSKNKPRARVPAELVEVPDAFQ